MTLNIQTDARVAKAHTIANKLKAALQHQEFVSNILGLTFNGMGF